jgi:hypothetical protein
MKSTMLVKSKLVQIVRQGKMSIKLPSDTSNESDIHGSMLSDMPSKWHNYFMIHSHLWQNCTECHV